MLLVLVSFDSRWPEIAPNLKGWGLIKARPSGVCECRILTTRTVFTAVGLKQRGF
jgi:hypothetical protein